MIKPILAVAAGLLLAATPAAAAAPSAGGAPELTAGTFTDPPLSVRPMYRWWLPLAALDNDELLRELDQMKANGAGGVEVDPFPVPGAANQANPFLETYGFGTPLWASKLKTMYRGAVERGLKIDITTSPNWPTTSPSVSRINDPAAQQQLIHGREQVLAGASRSGAIPGPASAPPTYSTTVCQPSAAGDSTLSVASTTGHTGGDRITVGGDTVTITAIAKGSPCGTLTVEPALAQPHTVGQAVNDQAKRTLVKVLVAQCATSTCPATGGTRMLDPASVQDVTDRLGAGETLDWTAPAGGNPWWVIAFYQTADGQTKTGLTATSPNYVIDHLGVAGAKALTDFYDEAILDPETKDLIRQVGDSALFEDSMEPSNPLKWTWGLLEQFEQLRGYSLTRLLPALAGTNVGAQSTSFFDFPTIGQRVRMDYRQTWSDLYGRNHLAVYNDWAHAHGMKTRIQVEGGPLQIADTAADPDIPEGENRNFLNNPELWKPIGIGAHLRDAEPVFSNECCPVSGGVWATTAGGPAYTVAQGTGGAFGGAGNNSNLNWVYKSYAGGVNQLVWHGFPYLTAPAGGGEQSVWPGFSFGGNNSFSEAFGPRMPQWDDYRSVNDHLARLQLILRQGRPRYDVAVFWHDFGVNGLAPNVTAFTGYPGLSTMFSTTSSMASAGFTYEYLSPRYLRDVPVRDGELYPDHVGFKALVLNAQQTIPLDSLRKIRDLARDQRFPLVIVGALPTRTPGYFNAASQDAEVAALSAEIDTLAAAGTHRVVKVDNQAGIPAALAALGVAPAAAHTSHPTSPDILAVRRKTADTDYYYLLNQSVNAVQQTVTLAGSGTPYELDTWTGRIAPVGAFAGGSGGVTLPVRIGANAVKVIAISRRALAGAAPPAVHAAQTDADEAVARDGDVLIRDTTGGQYTTTLADGRTVTTTIAGVQAARTLDAWTLDVESWRPDASNQPGVTAKDLLGPFTVNADATTHRLPTWTGLGLGDKAGRGVYRTTVDLPAATGAYLDLGTVVDTFRVTVNGRALPPLDYQDTSRIDLGGYLKAGANLIEVRVATPLRNAVRAATGAGGAALTTYGLLGPVRLQPYGEAVVYDQTTAPGQVGGTVPATLALTLGAPASFGAFTPGVDREYTATTSANVISTAGDAALSVSDPCCLANGSFVLSEPLQVSLSNAAWAGPVSNDPVTITFKQHIGATQPLRTGAYSKTLTFTLSTTTP
jgi:hypothetical protein